ncbi:hypothetical protein [Fulvimarina sp. MAC3]|uniref:hypothetical protein n=1 Tax=Fulvimarina sp. MAC3 TaxID=3148887 RepID=UPI0031FE3CF9
MIKTIAAAALLALTVPGSALAWDGSEEGSRVATTAATCAAMHLGVRSDLKAKARYACMQRTGRARLRALGKVDYIALSCTREKQRYVVGGGVQSRKRTAMGRLNYDCR